MRTLSLLFIVLGLVFSSAAIAQETDYRSTFDLDQQTDSCSLWIGAGAVMSRPAYKGMETEASVIPLIDFEYGDFYIKGLQTGYKIMEDCGWKAYLVGQFRSGVYDDSYDDDDYLDGMRERGETFDGGLALSYDHEFAVFTATYLTDLFSKHQGQEVRLTASKRFNYCDLSLTPTVGISYFDSNFNNFYYGVRDKEARVNRPAYSVGESINWFAGINGLYKLDEKWSIYSLFTYEWLPNEITDSPVITRDYQTSLIAGLMYKFR